MIEIELKDGPFAGQVYRLPALMARFALPHWAAQSGRMHEVFYRWTGEIKKDARRVFEYEGTR